MVYGASTGQPSKNLIELMLRILDYNLTYAKDSGYKRAVKGLDLLKVLMLPKYELTNLRTQYEVQGKVRKAKRIYQNGHYVNDLKAVPAFS